MINLPDHKYQPLKYYFLTLLISWATMFTGAWFSHQEQLASYQFLFLLTGMLTPFGVALFLIFGSQNRALISDYKKRIFNLALIRPRYWPALLLILPFVTLSATAISLLFGQPVQQFRLSPEFVFSGGEFFIMLIILILAPTFEELGWRGYGVDSLIRKGRSLFTSTMIFAILWNLWHLPLFFVKGYYHYEILHTNVLYGINFVVAIFPAAFLMNWIFYRNNRSIPAIILFHFLLNLSGSMLQTEQFTKCIVTILLIIITGVIIGWERRFFFGKQVTEAQVFAK